MGTRHQLVSSFVPRSVARSDPSAAISTEAVATRFFAAVLLVDITDFTSLTDRFERSGAEGLE